MFFKKNILNVLFLICILAIFLNNFIIANRDYKLILLNNNKKNEYCLRLNGEYNNEDEENMCEFYLSDDYNISFLDVFLNLSFNGFQLHFLIIIMIIILCICYYNNSIIKNGVYSFFLSRISYYKFLKKLIFRSYLPCFIYVFVLTFFYILYYVRFGSFSDLSKLIGNYSILLFVITSIIVTLLNFMGYANICLIVMRKKMNYFLTCIISFVIIMLSDLFFEVIFDTFLNIAFKFDSSYMFGNILARDYINESIPFVRNIFIPIIFFVISFIIMIKEYSSKEKMFIDLND